MSKRILTGCAPTAGSASRAAAYKRVTDKLGALRMALDWDVVLELTRELDEWLTYRSPREGRADMRRRYKMKVAASTAPREGCHSFSLPP
jgi:hypothetical protein